MDELMTLQKENARLTAVVESMDKSARLLVHRDLELRRANVELQTLDTQKSEFISIAAHQIRTPLSALRWSQQMLIDGDLGVLSTPQRDIIVLAQQSVVRLVNLANNLLEVEHLELQNDKKDSTIFDLNLLIKEACAEFNGSAALREITLTVQLAGSPAVICARTESIKDALLNLLDNAIKYTPLGGTVGVEVKVADVITVTVTDSGIGIPREHQDKIFKRFSRAENAKKIDADGSGLGLYIVKKIMESFAGTVNFTSTEGAGTTFVLTFKQYQPSV